MLGLRFFNRDPEEVAVELVGCVLVRKLEGKELRARIVETEAYYGENDPASRARKGKKLYNSPMFERAGLLFVYNVHRYWMLNITAKPVSAVLIRAAEPLNFKADLKGPGKVTMALKIDRKLNGKELGKESGLWIEKGRKPKRIGASKRIGVSADLDRPLRFFDLDSPAVSAHRKFERVILQ